ncbi:hypothetical protein ACHAXT_005043 [Thalassiosira profunda]
MSYFGAWVDGNGNKYKAPYACAFALGIAGSLIYFLAILFPKGYWSVGVILMGRFVTGLGESGRTLAYSWVATAIPRNEQRTTLTIMSMTRTVGLMMGPLMNLPIAEANAEVLGIPIRPYNAPGLLVAALQVILFVATRFFLTDPPAKLEGAAKEKGGAQDKKGWQDIAKAAINFDLLLCTANMFVVMFSFTFYGTTIPPVASYVFSWTPVQISNVLALQAVVLFLGMVASMWLSMTSAPDVLLMIFGQSCFLIGGTMTYFSWTTDAHPLQFLIPIIVVSMAYPFIGPANRSKFTKGVHDQPELENSHGVMQSLFNQSFQIAGLISPTFTTTLILRGPGDAPESRYTQSLWFFVIPAASLSCIVGLVYEELVLRKEGEESIGELEEVPATETSPLMMAGKRVSKRRSSVVEIKQYFSCQNERDRRFSCEANIGVGGGILNPFETKDEVALRKKLLHDKKEWEELEKLDAAMEAAE